MLGRHQGANAVHELWIPEDGSLVRPRRLRICLRLKKFRAGRIIAAMQFTRVDSWGFRLGADQPLCDKLFRQTLRILG